MMTGSRQSAVQWMAAQDSTLLTIETVFYVYIFVSAFLHVIIEIPGLPFAMVVGVGIMALFHSFHRLGWAALPGMLFLTMAIIDGVAYSLDIKTLITYFVWATVFVIFLVLHQDERFFSRAKIVLFLYLLAHLYYAAPDPNDPTRLSLARSAPPRFGITNSNELAYWCGFGVFSGMVGFWNSRNWKSALFLLSAAISAIYLIQTVSRSGLLVTVVASGGYLLLSFRRLTTSTLLTTGFALLLGAAVFHESLQHGIEQYQARDEQEEASGDFSGRVPLNAEGLRVFLESPLYGTGNSLVSAPGVNDPKPPHNAFLAMGVHYGIFPTLLLFLLWAITLCKSAWLAYRTIGASETEPVVDGCELFALALFVFMMINMATLSEVPLYATLYVTRILSAK